MGGHTINEVMQGNSFPRNPLMANFCAKTMPYRGLGSGIPRVLSEDSDVQFVDDKAGNQFKAIVKRHTDGYVAVNTKYLSERLSVNRKTIQRDLAILQEQKLIRWGGSDKTGHWVIIRE